MQADVCHAYHVFHDYMGIPSDRIIVMMYDDIALNPKNPYPGKIINDINGKDVYAGVPHDVTSTRVTPQNFMTLMTGGSVAGTKKTLKSTSNDNVFLYFSDHGGMYCLGFPNTVMSASQVQQAMNTMISKKMFKNLIFYVDACYSGSVFYRMKLPDNVYVATAAPIGEYAYSCDYDRGLANFPCDRFSHFWMTDMEKNNKKGHTFSDELKYVQQNIEYSQPCSYGGKNSVGKMTINSFFNLADGDDMNMTVKGRETKHTGVPQFDVPFALAQHLYEQNPNDENRKNYQRELNIRKAINSMNYHIMNAAKPGVDPVTLSVCQKCDTSCKCYQFCLKEKSQQYCKAECCNENSACYSPPPKVSEEVFDNCLDILVEEYYKSCGMEHGYLRKIDGMFYRLCKRGGVNVDAAVKEIHKQCALFKEASF